MPGCAHVAPPGYNLHWQQQAPEAVCYSTSFGRYNSALPEHQAVYTRDDDEITISEGSFSDGSTSMEEGEEEGHDQDQQKCSNPSCHMQDQDSQPSTSGQQQQQHAGGHVLLRFGLQHLQLPFD
jgi:hypothetical protein